MAGIRGPRTKMAYRLRDLDWDSLMAEWDRAVKTGDRLLSDGCDREALGRLATGDSSALAAWNNRE